MFTGKKIGVIAQEGTNPAFVQGVYYVVNNLLCSSNATDKFQVFLAPNATPFVDTIVRDGIRQAILDERYIQRGYCQINAKPIIDGYVKVF